MNQHTFNRLCKLAVRAKLAQKQQQALRLEQLDQVQRCQEAQLYVQSISKMRATVIKLIRDEARKVNSLLYAHHMSLQQDTVAPMNLQTVKAFMQQENHLTQVSDAECKRLDAKLRAAQDYLGQCLILAEPVLRIQEAAQTTFQDFKQALIEFVATQPSHSDENQITRLAQEFCRAPVVAQHINAWFGTRWRYSEPVSTTDENLINAIETLITKLNDELPSTFFPRTARLKQEKIMALHCLLEYAVMTEEPISACIPFILQDFPGAVTGIFSRVELLLEAASDHAINNRNCIKNN